MNRNNKISVFSNVGGDLAAGLVVFLIAVPLCLGIALASGAPLFSGIIAGIVGGIVVGTVSKSQLSVSGPAAGLTAIVLAAITELGAFDLFLCAVILAGVIQIALGFLKAGSIANYIPSNVIEGMLAAIGVIIILKQIPHALGFDKDYEGDFAFWESTGNNTFTAIIQAFNFITPGAVIIALISVAILLLWDKTPFLKKMIFLPGPLIVVVLSVILNEILLASGSSLAISPEHLVNLPIANSLSELSGQLVRPNFSGLMNPAVWTVALTLGIVASIETLLCIEATDKLDTHKRYTPTNHELKAQGIGNIVSGFLGGLPLTSVIIRSSANINAKAETKLACITHGVLLLLCAATIPFLLNKIPLAALAAILILTGYKLARPAVFAHMWKNGKYQFVPFIVTIVAVVFTDLLVGVGLGLAVSVFLILRENLKVPYFFRQKEYQDGNIIHIHLAQEVSFLNKAAIKMTLEHLPADSYVIIDASETSFIDYDVREIIREFKEVKAAEKGVRLELVGFKENYRLDNSLSKDFVYLENGDENRPIFDFNPKKNHLELLNNLTNNGEALKT